jgi:signal transduction histidine kinase
MKKYFLIPLFLILANFSFSQNKIVKKEFYLAKIDSVKMLLAKEKVDSVIYKLQDELAQFHFQIDAKENIRLLESYLVFAKKSGNTRRIINRMLGLAYHYNLVGESPKSIPILQEVIQITEKTDIENYSIAVCFLARNYINQKDWKNAVYFAKICQVTTEQMLKKRIPIQLAHYVGAPMTYAECLEGANQLDSALFYAKLSEQRLKTHPNDYPFIDNRPVMIPFIFETPFIFGNIYSKKNQNELALFHYKNGLAIAEKYVNSHGIEMTSMALAKLNYKLNLFSEAKKYAKTGLESAQNTSNYLMGADLAQILKNIYEKENDTSLALKYANISNAFKDSVSSTEKQRKIADYTFAEEKRLKDIENLELANRNKLIVIGLIAGLALISIIGFVLYRNNQQKQKINDRLSKQQAEIEQLNKNLENIVEQRTSELKVALNEAHEALLKGQTTERKRVASELHDNLGGLLSAIKLTTYSLDTHELKPHEQETYAQMITMIDTATNQIRSLSHNLLPEELEQKGLVNSLETLVKTLNLGNKTTFHFSCQGLINRLNRETEFNLYAICLELCNNIIKHSNATDANIELIQKENNIVLLVSDNGVGISEKRNLENGMGLKNLKERATAIGGTVKIRSNVNEGTLISIKLEV